MSNFTVLFDACVLYPFGLRDLLVQLATTGIYRARWTDEIHSEWIRNVVEKGMDENKAKAVRDLMILAVPDSCITGYENLTEGLKEKGLPDNNDAHVIAAAIRGDVDMIVTWNLKHFPEEVMYPLHIEMQDPDDFLMNQLDLDTPKVLQSVKACRERFNDPEFTPQEYIAMLERQRLPNTALELRPYAEVKLI